MSYKWLNCSGESFTLGKIQFSTFKLTSVEKRGKIQTSKITKFSKYNCQATFF